MQSIGKAIDKALEILGIVSFAILVLLTLFGVISRYLFPVPIAFGEEVGRFLFIWTSFLGAAIVMKKNEHIRLDIFQGNISERGYKKLQIFVFFVIAVFCVVVFFAGSQALEVAFKQTAPVSRLSMGVVYLILPGSALLMGLYSVTFMVKTILSLKGGSK
ncbi:MAG: TRAP transporter small permease [Treponemataceae bacterium]